MTTDPTRAAESVVEQRHIEYAATFYASRVFGESKEAERNKIRKRIAEGYVDPLAYLFAKFERDHMQRPTDTASAGEALKGKADSAKGWFRRAFAAEARVLELESGLRKIATGSIKGEPGNHKDALSICQGIASELLTTPSPVTDERVSGGRSALIASMEEMATKMAGEICIYGDEYGPDNCGDCHGCLQLAASGLFARAMAALASTPQPAAAETVERAALEKLSDHFTYGWGDDTRHGVIRAVEQIAKEALAAIRQSAKGSGECQSCCSTFYEQPASAETVERAVAAERERCAKICDREATLRIQRAGSNDSNWGDPSVQIHKSVTAKRLAAAIRQSAKGGE